MQWLNAVDDALDWVLGPSESAEGEAGGAGSPAAVDEGAAAAAAALASGAAGSPGPVAPPEGAGEGGAGSPAPDGRAPPEDQQMNAGTGVARFGSELQQEGGSAANNTAVPAASPQPPSPPPLPAKRKNAATPPPTHASARANPSMLPPDARPSTPLVAMAGEFLVVDDDVHNTPSSVQNTSSSVHNASSEKDGDSCGEGDNCIPSDSLGANDKTEGMLKGEEGDVAGEEEEGETTIEQEAEIAIRRQMQQPLTPLSMARPASVTMGVTSDAGIDEAEHQTPLMAQMQDIARRSPAPTKVTMGDRGGTAMPSPPVLEEAAHQTNEPPTENGRRGMVIRLPAPSNASDVSPLKSSRSLQSHPKSGPRSVGGAPRATPGVIRRRVRAPSLSSEDSSEASTAEEAEGDATMRSATGGAPRATPRATPGVIRRRVRAPSLSSEESSEPSVAEVAGGDAKMDGASAVPPPPFIPGASPAPPPSPPGDDAATRTKSASPGKASPKIVQQTTTNDEWDDNAKPSTSGGRGAKLASFSPLPLRTDHVTPVADNRKTQQKEKVHPSPLHEVDENDKNAEGRDSATKPLNRAKKEVDWAPEPVHVSPKADDADGGAKGDEHAAAATNDEESAEKEGAITDTIAGWFKRSIGSTDENQLAKANDTNDGDGSFSDSFHSQASNESELTGSDEMDDFAIPSPTFDRLRDDDLSSWDPSLNRYGFFHVRILRAQRLPCGAGSSVNATLSLQPWKGRIRIPAHATVDGPEGAGVCLRWDKSPERKRRAGSKDKPGGSKEGSDSREGGLCSHSMVHAYNSEDTPVPIIALELTVSSLGVFDRFLCAVSIPCHGLLRNPRRWTQQWYRAGVIQGHEIDEEDDEMMEETPLVLLETCFEPKSTRTTVRMLTGESLKQDTPELDATDPLHTSEDSDTLGSIPQIIRPDRLQDDESSTLTPALVPRNSAFTKSHLMRVRYFWTPAWCAVCSKTITTGWMASVKNFECEACGLYCCRDCQLSVDARLPCGSELATISIQKAQQYQMPSVSRIMSTLAPHTETSEGEKAPGVGDGETDSNRQTDMKVQNDGRRVKGIGIMNVRVMRACLFDKTFPSEVDPNEVFNSEADLRHGDHYVRVSWLGSKESKRTKTVLQSSRPVFDSEQMMFDVPHYGMEYKLEVVDSNTDRPVGSCLLSAQGLLQWQRDDMLSRTDRLLLSFFHLRKYSEPRRVKLELRTGVKDGFGLSFYNSSKTADGGSKAGEISGWLEVDVHLDEDRQLFYSPNPRRCPPRTEEEFDISLIQLHIARIGELIEGVQKLVSAYLYVVSWENRHLTGASLFIFVLLTLTFNLEYLGALPVGCLVLYMVYLAYLRVNGHFKDRWTMKEKEALIKSESKVAQNQSIFRPVGLLQVGDLRGKNLRSKELGLPGSFYASVMYDPLRYADEKLKSSQTKVDSSSGCTHEVGATISPGITSSPIWLNVQVSPELMRLKHLLPDDRLWRQEKEEDSSLAYPILQPITETGGYSQSDEVESARRSDIQLMPWEHSCGAVVIQARFSDVLGTFQQMFDNVLGEVVIPLSKLAGSGRPVEGWFRLLDVGTKDTVPGETSDDASVSSRSSTDAEEEGEAKPAMDLPELYVKVQFSPNVVDFGGTSLSDDGETQGADSTTQRQMQISKVICEELSRTASISQDNSLGMIGSQALNTINTVRTLGGKLQNQISIVVDTLERVRNAFNFSNPRITVFILVALSLLWLVLALIPTRIVVLFAGLAQFGATYYSQFVSKPKRKTVHNKEKDDEGEDNKGNPLENLFLSIPTDEDLRRTYFWEARRLGEKERERFAEAKRHGRLEKLWKARWHGALEVKEKKEEQPASPSSARIWSWGSAFALIEGHRFIWWRSERHFDTGEAPLGQLLFAGHSGLAGLSPLDLRELSPEEVPFVVSIFGRGISGQQKMTLLASSSSAKHSLEIAVVGASMDAKAD